MSARLSLLSVAALLGVGGAAHALELDGLVKNSPFGQAAERTVIGEAKPGTLEFRGLYVDKGVTYFSVYNSITKQSAWIAEGEVPANLPVTIVGFDAAISTSISGDVTGNFGTGAAIGEASQWINIYRVFNV